MTRNSTLGFAALSTVSLAIALRLVPLTWSPYPTTLDGFVHARVARTTLVQTHLPKGGLRADQILEPLLLALGSSITGISPVLLAQPLYSILGSITLIVAFVFVKILGEDLSLSRFQIKLAGVLVGLSLAVDGIFIRRTGTPDSDALTLLLIPLATLALYLYVRRGRPAWLLLGTAVLSVLPILHTLGTLIGALGLTALVPILWLSGFPTDRVAKATALVGAFWLYFAAYYQVAPELSLGVPYLGRISNHPGLFLAWLLLMVLGALWYRNGSTRTQRIVFLLPLGFLFLVAGVNRWVHVFPGTVQTPDLVLILLLPLLVPVTIASYSTPVLTDSKSAGIVLLALVAAPLTQIFFSLTASLTPDFFATAMRSQTFTHLSIAIVLGIAGAAIFTRLSGVSTSNQHRALLRTGVVLLILVPIAWSLPLAYIDLDTGAYPRGTIPSEFQSAAFTNQYVEGSWTSDHKQSRLVGDYFGASGRIGPTHRWLSGGAPPSCTLVSKQTWITSGAHFFPTGPSSISAERYRETLDQRNLIYGTTGYDRISLSVPVAASQESC